MGAMSPHRTSGTNWTQQSGISQIKYINNYSYVQYDLYILYHLIWCYVYNFMKIYFTVYDELSLRLLIKAFIQLSVLLVQAAEGQRASLCK